MTAYTGTARRGHRRVGVVLVDEGMVTVDIPVVERPHVVALIGDEATVKYYFPEKDYVRFQPANKAMAPILAGRSLPSGRVGAAAFPRTGSSAAIRQQVPSCAGRGPRCAGADDHQAETSGTCTRPPDDMGTRPRGGT